MSKNKEYCKGMVPAPGGWHTHPCSFKAWKDGYCKKHHPEEIKRRDAEREARELRAWEAQKRRRKETDLLRLIALAEEIGLYPDCIDMLRGALEANNEKD